MDPDFWHNRWKNNQIGFHIDQVNPLLKEHFSVLCLKKGDCIFLPLCGKTLDIHWLLDQGLFVVGVELSSIAIIQLFEDLGIKPNIEEEEKFVIYSSEGIRIYVGDFFDLTESKLGEVQAVYDRAALVALPSAMRKNYTKKLMELTRISNQLTIVFDYDQTQMDGPPFSLSDREIKSHYEDFYELKLIYNEPVASRFRANPEMKVLEKVWSLNQK